jgi:peptidyl-prolyl cis-trans isomerase C
MNTPTKFLLPLFFTLVFFSPCFAQDGPSVDSTVDSEEVFARQGGVELTRGELYGSISRMPPDLQLRFVRDGAQVDNLITLLLRTKLIAAAAIESGYDQEMLVRNRMQLAAENELAEAWIANLILKAEEADYEVLAEEYYLVHPDEFQSQEMVDASHILIKSDNRNEQDALDIANSILADLRADPTQFDAFIIEFSEDPAKDSNLGRYSGILRGQMVEPFENAVFSMEQPGEISDPVKTAYGYHIIRLNRIMPAQLVPFDQIKEQLMNRSKEKYLADYRVRYIRKQITYPIELLEGAGEALVKHYFGDDLELAPQPPE